mmetsp:Transcript_17227/g.55929  ORF Transcript_17227/g.55929 Transcript_17227/m.55929 type:complete len:109 (+) Transcript_17227:506-832(+)
MNSRFMRRTTSMSTQKLSAGSVPMEPREARASLGSRSNLGSSAILLYKHETSSGSKCSTRSFGPHGLVLLLVLQRHHVEALVLVRFLPQLMERHRLAHRQSQVKLLDF